MSNAAALPKTAKIKTTAFASMIAKNVGFIRGKIGNMGLYARQVEKVGLVGKNTH